jgi:biopolymer transport protein TolR
MAMMIGGGGGRRSGRRRGGLSAEINVTPFVDVMLVLLIVFMVTAPMLTTGVAVDLPRTRAGQLPSTDQQPIVLTVDKEGAIYVGTQEDAIDMDSLTAVIAGIAENDLTRRVFIRGDTTVEYGKVISVLSTLQAAGFRNAAMVVDSQNLPKPGGN